MNIRPELTAISTKHSKSAEILLGMACEADIILDYGCGTCRNMGYLLDNGVDASVLCGTDIPAQLEAQKEKMEAMRNKGCTIATAPEFTSNYFDFILCSHVLNVIEDDSVKIAVLSDIKRLLVNSGTAIIEVRTVKDVEGAKTKEAYKDGYIIKKGSAYTYQEGITKEKMEHLCSLAGLKVIEHIFNNSKHIIVVTK